jgi:hypothetical protein
MFQPMRAIDKTREALMPKMGQEMFMVVDAPSSPRLDPVEWRVVALALRDADRAAWQEPRPGSLRNWLARVYSRLTGSMPALSLADPRLDTLRRFVHATRSGRTVADALVPAMLACGFNRAQVDAIGHLSR